MKKLLPMLNLVCSAAFAALTLLPAIHAAAQPESQGQQPSQPQFDAASIRPSGANQRESNGLYTYPGGKIRCNGCTLQYLIMGAFHVEPFQIAGGTSWTELTSGTRYDIQAIPPAASASSHSNPATPKNPPNEEQRQMLQSLLIDRFQLKSHHETKEGPVFILTKGKKTLKLEAPKDKNAFSWAGPPAGAPVHSGEFTLATAVPGLSGTNISMPQLAARISGWVKRPVLDQTGLQGSYDFEYRMGGDDDDPNTDRQSSIFTSLKEIGLNLASAKGPVDTIVIDHAEQPSPN